MSQTSVHHDIRACWRRSAAPEVPAAGRLDFLDGIRALAALFVVAHHIYIAVYPGFPENTGPWFLGWLLYGNFAVAVFIVVSGFSLDPGPGPPRTTGWPRVRPLHQAPGLADPAGLLGGGAGVVAAGGAGRAPRIDVRSASEDVIVHLLLVQDGRGNTPPNGALWSIAIEWQLYFVFPIFLLARRLGGPAATAHRRRRRLGPQRQLARNRRRSIAS